MSARALTEAEIASFHEQGYLFVEGALAPADIAPFIAELEGVIDRAAAELHAAGAIASPFADRGFDERLARISEATDAAFRAVFSGVHRGPALFDLLRHEAVLALVEPLIGPEIMCHPAYRVRPKLPDLDRTKRLTVVPWHQDASYMDPACDGALMVTVWIALTESTIDNGCLEVIPGGHRGGILPHRNVRGRTYLDILPDALPSAAPVAVTARPGDVLLMTNLTPHRSTPNRTQRIRWSIDARYHDAGVPSGYPQEAGFLARSRRRPEAATASLADFERIRTTHAPGPPFRWKRWPTEEQA